MKRYWTLFPLLLTMSASAAPPGTKPSAPLADTAWQLHAIQSMDDAQGTTRIAAPERFTMRLDADGKASFVLDCNQGMGTWQAKAAGDCAGNLSFGPIATTRALCPPPHLDERIARDLTYMRGYRLKDGNLYVTLMADGGIYEWHPAPSIPPSVQSALGQPEDPVAGQVLGSAIHTRDAGELRYYVMKELTGRYAQEQGITVTPEEIDAYVRHVQAGLDKDLRQREARRDELAGKLAAGTLNEAERRATSAELKTLNELVAALKEMAASANQNPQETKVARQQVATAFILQWKINRALHRHYGGRIGFQQGGPEPLDAHYAFLRNHEARGDFAILDRDLANSFWYYYLTDSLHSFFAPGSPEAAKAFAEPPWLAKR